MSAMHLTLKDDDPKPAAFNFLQQQERFEDFIRVYNQERPHQALDVQSKNYALDVIRNVTETASARLQFARFAFGAAGSAGAQIDLGNAESLSRGLIGNGKHKLIGAACPAPWPRTR